MRAIGQPLQAAPSIRPALALAVTAYLLATGGSVVLLLLVGGWAFLLLPGLAGLTYLVLDPLRASLFMFAFLPPLSEFLPVAVRNTPLFAALGTLVVAWLIALIRGTAQVPAHYVGIYAGFLGAVALSVLFRQDLSLYIPLALQSTAAVMVIKPLMLSLVSVLLISAVPDRGALRKLAWGIVLSGLGYTVVSLFVDLQDVPGMVDFERSPGIYAGVHNAGLFEIFYLLVAAALFASERHRARRFFLAGSAVLFLAGAYASGSRTAWVALAVVLSVAVWQDRLQLWRKLRFGHWYLATVLVLLALPVVLTRVFKISPAAQTSLGGVPPFWEGRIVLAKLGLELFAQSPLTGVGFGTHTFLIPVQLAPQGFIPYIHTYYVTVLAETGVLGFAVFLLIVGVAGLHFVRALRAFRREADTELYYLTWAFFLGFCAVLVMFLMQGETGYPLFWAMVAMAFVVRRLALRGSRR